MTHKGFQHKEQEYIIQLISSWRLYHIMGISYLRFLVLNAKN